MSWTLLLSLASAQDDAIYLGDIGVAATLPEGWSIPRWGDSYLVAVDDKQRVEVELTYSAWQVPVTEENAAIWATLSEERLAEGAHTDVKRSQLELIEAQGRPTAAITLDYQYQGKQAAVLYQHSFAVEGATAHLTATAVKGNASRARAALELWEQTLEVTKPAPDLGTAPLTLSVEPSGFESTLPEGWRDPLHAELVRTRNLVDEALKEKIDPEKCWVALSPYSDGVTRLMLACRLGLWTGIVDEHSFEGMDADFRGRFFGRGLTIDRATAVPAGEDGRLSFLYALPDVGDRGIRMAATPYDQGHLVVYAVGKADDGAALSEALTTTLAQTRFTGPEGGVHPIGVLQWMQYTASYRRTSPTFLVPVGVLALLLIGAVTLVLKRKPRYADLDD